MPGHAAANPAKFRCSPQALSDSSARGGGLCALPARIFTCRGIPDISLQRIRRNFHSVAFLVIESCSPAKTVFRPCFSRIASIICCQQIKCLPAETRHQEGHQRESDRMEISPDSLQRNIRWWISPLVAGNIAGGRQRNFAGAGYLAEPDIKHTFTHSLV